MSQARPACSARQRRGGGEELEHVAAVDRLRAVRAPGRQREHRQALDQPHEEAERARAGARSTIEARSAIDSGAAVQQRLLDRQARGEVARRARRRAGTQAAEVDDPPHAGRAAPRAAKRSAWRRSTSANAAGRRPPSSGSGSRRPRRRRAPRSSPAPVVASPSTRSSSCAPAAAHPLARAGEAAHGVAVAREARHERGADVARTRR